jgi:phosphoglycerol transferase MdoB-like AlkP superfamily enzyme
MPNDGNPAVRSLRQKLFLNRYAGTVLFVILFLTVAFCTRLVLAVRSYHSLDTSFFQLITVFGWGAVYDLAAAAYAAVPLAIYAALAPRRWLQGRIHRWLSLAFIGITIYLLLFSALAEWLFWTEFSSRFNFIAVDYLIYTTEVIGNIRESYPLPVLLGAIAVGTGLVMAGLSRAGVLNEVLQSGAAKGMRFLPAGGLAAAALLGHFALKNRDVPEFGNAFNQELARNGTYAFFAAYRENELIYDKFYSTLPATEAFAQLRSLLNEGNTTFVSNEPTDITRRVEGQGQEKKWNVIQVTVESLSAAYLGAFGNQKHLTPNLDRLFAESISFTNLFATGTRTVRGMEALTLSVPPTPGQSIVRRPHNQDLFSLGAVFRSHGYDTAFIYSGHGYFDNMNAFFAGNGYRVIDRGTVNKADVTYATTWGACDEDLYRWTLREADAAYAQGKPFYHFVMTTSNHRPYGFPAGKIDLPTGKRSGAVKYTDYAIGELIRQAQSRPWFTNTLFVIVADHCASSAGKSTLPVAAYHIPALIWNPNLVSPAKIGSVCSQIDLPPTMLALMGWTYETRFFGKDILAMRPEDERAFISTYQKLGYLHDGKLEVIEPVRRHHEFRYELISGDLEPVVEDAVFGQAVTCYQTASHLFSHGLNHF